MVPKRLFSPILSFVWFFLGVFNFIVFFIQNGKSDPRTCNDSNESAADNDGHISSEELAHKKEDNGEIVSKLKELFRGETVTAFEGKLSICFV